MNAHELRTSLEKAETQPEIVVRKAEKKLRFSAQPETKTAFTNNLRQFSAKNKNSLKQSYTTIVASLQLPSLGGAGRGEDGLIFSRETPFPTRVSPEFYFTAPCNHFSLKAFHNISDKVKILFNPISHPFQELRPVCGMHKTPAIPPGPCGSHYRFIPDKKPPVIAAWSFPLLGERSGEGEPSFSPNFLLSDTLNTEKNTLFFLRTQMWTFPSQLLALTLFNRSYPDSFSSLEIHPRERTAALERLLHPVELRMRFEEFAGVE